MGLRKEHSGDQPSPAVEGVVLEPSDAIGFELIGVAGCLTAAGLFLSTRDAFTFWLVGQLVLAIALLQWFVLLHEAGHATLFRLRAANFAAGHVAGFFALIPFSAWRRVHGLHHLWTGWQDLDPTTASLAPRQRARAEAIAADLAWKTGLPLFSIVYRLGNYWNVARLCTMFGERRPRRVLLSNVCSLLLAYALLLWLVGPAQLMHLAALALLLSLALQDPLILSQHTHIPQRLSRGRNVRPLPPAEQLRYTRSLRFPSWISRWILFGFDAHELHHRFPGIPGCRLRGMARATANEVHWWEWLRAAKRLRGSVLLFENSESTGFRR